MARTIDNIYNDLVAIKDNLASFLTPLGDDANTLKSDVDSNSKVAKWRLWLFTVAVSIHRLEVNIDTILEKVTKRKKETPVATLRWYKDRAFEFRNGYSLEFDNKKYQFSQAAKTDNSAAIVKRASAVVASTQIRVKVADLDSNDDPKALTQSQKNSVQAYFDKIKPAGIPLAVISEPPDLLNVEVEVVYDPLVLKSNGEKINEQGVFPVSQAIDGYIEGLQFDAVFNINQMVDAIQAAQGVNDLVLKKVEARADQGASFQTLFDVTASGPKEATQYSTFAGYMKLNTLTDTYITR